MKFKLKNIKLIKINIIKIVSYYTKFTFFFLKIKKSTCNIVIKIKL